MQYGADAIIRYRFTDPQNEDSLLDMVEKMPHTLEDHTYGGNAINTTLQNIFPYARDAENQKARRVMVITNLCL